MKPPKPSRPMREHGHRSGDGHATARDRKRRRREQQRLMRGYAQSSIATIEEATRKRGRKDT